MTTPTVHHVRFPGVYGQILAELQRAARAWSDQYGLVNIREKFEGSPHEDTESIYLRAPPWPMTDPRAAQNDLRVVNWPVAQLDPNLLAALASLEKVVGKNMARAMIVKLKPGGIITPHIDQGPYAESTDRFHFPIETNEDAISTIDDESVHMPAGTLWFFDKSSLHGAKNGGDADRVHLIFDVWVGS